MVNITQDALIHVSEVAKRFPTANGQRTVRSVVNWIKKGIRGVKLAAEPVGDTWYTTEDAILEFSRQLRETSTPRNRPHKKSSAREKARANAKARLKAKGY